MSKLVIIRKEHCNGDYMFGTKYPLAKAIQEQYPEYPLKAVSGDGQILKKDNSFGEYYPSYNENGWCLDRMYDLLEDKIKEFHVYVS